MATARAAVVAVPAGASFRAPRIELCGGLSVTLDGSPLEDGLPGRQGRLLFAYLVLNRDRPLSRDELIEAIWWRAAPGSPGSALSALLSRLRRLLGPGRLDGRGEVRLVLPADVQVDVDEAERAAAAVQAALVAGRPHEAIRRAAQALEVTEGGLLPGHDAPWLDECRRDLEELALRALECTAQAGLALGGAGLAEGERAARRVVERAPYRETGYRRLMEVQEAKGDLAEALCAYERLRCLLRDELGTAPAPAIQEIHARLLRAGAAPRGGPTLGQRLRHRDRTRFVGREHELDLFDRLFVDDPPLSVVLVHGPAGIGKSALLREVTRRGRERGWTPHLVDGRELLPVPDALEDALAGVTDEERPLLLFDTYERMQAIDGYLRHTLLPALPERALVVIAGRAAPGPGWYSAGWENLAAELELDRLTRSEAVQLLRAGGIPDEASIERILAWSAGSPLALSLAASRPAGPPLNTLHEAGTPGEVLRPLLRRLTHGELEAPQQATLAVAAIARVTTPELIEAVLPGADPVAAYAWLASRTFAEPVADGLALHELVRSAVREDLRRTRPDTERDLRRRIADHLHERALGGRLALTIDLAELVHNELIRWGYGWQGSTEYRVDAVRPRDAEVVARLLARREHASWWAPTRPFFEEAPERVAVARDAEDRLCGYVIAVTAANAPGFADDDPLLGRWLARARSHDPNAVLFRDSVDFTTGLAGDASSRVQAMVNLAGILRSELTNPRFAYLPVNPLNEAAVRFTEAVGAVHLPELDARTGDHEIHCYLLDHGPGGVLGLQRDVVHYECGGTTPLR